MNAASINIPSNFIAGCQSTLKRCASASSDVERRAVLDRQTMRGLWWAIEFVGSLQTPYMSEAELKHAIRLTYFRGAECPSFPA